MLAHHSFSSSSTFTELDALGDDFEEEEGIPSYLREDATTELPDFVDEPPVAEQVSASLVLGMKCPLIR